MAERGPCSDFRIKNILRQYVTTFKGCSLSRRIFYKNWIATPNSHPIVQPNKNDLRVWTSTPFRVADEHLSFLLVGLTKKAGHLLIF